MISLHVLHTRVCMFETQTEFPGSHRTHTIQNFIFHLQKKIDDLTQTDPDLGWLRQPFGALPYSCASVQILLDQTACVSWSFPDGSTDLSVGGGEQGQDEVCAVRRPRDRDVVLEQVWGQTPNLSVRKGRGNPRVVHEGQTPCSSSLLKLRQTTNLSARHGPPVRFATTRC